MSGVLGELILAVRYNTYNPNNNSKELLVFLENTRVVVKNYFSRKISLAQLFAYIRSIISYAELQGVTIKLTLVMLDFIKKILADAEYKALFSAEHDYLLEIEKTLVKIADAFNLKFAISLKRLNFLEEIFECFWEILDFHPVLLHIFPFKDLLLILELLSGDSQKKVLELLFRSSLQKETFVDLIKAVSSLYYQEGLLSECVIKSLQISIGQVKLSDSLCKEFIDLNELLVKEITATSEESCQLNLLGLLANLVKKQIMYLHSDEIEKYILILLRAFSLSFNDFDLDRKLTELINTVTSILSEIETRLLTKLISEFLIKNDYALVYNLLNRLGSSYIDGSLVNNMADNFSFKFS